MKNLFVIFFLIIFFNINALSEDSIPITISSTIFYGANDEWLQLKITNTSTDQVWYDSSATVFATNGFQDTIYLDSGTYKCEIIDMGANVSMPVITLNNGYIVPWGYPAYEYYLFTVPGGELNTYSSISDTACFSYNSPSLKYNWTESGIYLDTIPNSIGYDSIITINLTIVSIDNSVYQSDGGLTAVESNAEYQWLVCNSGSVIVGAIDQNYIPPTNGLYSVRITKGGCQETSDCYSFVANDIKEQQIFDAVSAYPNPTNGLVNIETRSRHAILYVEITDITGKSLAKYIQPDQNMIQLDLSGFNSGFYFANIYTESDVSTFKIIKK